MRIMRKDIRRILDGAIVLITGTTNSTLQVKIMYINLGAWVLFILAQEVLNDIWVAW